MSSHELRFLQIQATKEQGQVLPGAELMDFLTSIEYVSARYIPPNHTTNLSVKVIRGLLPETVTLDFSVNRSITIGMMCLIEVLAMEVAVKI